MAGSERERDDALCQTRSRAAQPRETEEDSNSMEGRLQQLQQSLSAAEEDKEGIDGRLASAQTRRVV